MLTPDERMIFHVTMDSIHHCPSILDVGLDGSIAAWICGEMKKLSKSSPWSYLGITRETGDDWRKPIGGLLGGGPITVIREGEERTLLLANFGLLFLHDCGCYDCVTRDLAAFAPLVVVNGYLAVRGIHPMAEKVRSSRHGDMEVNRAIESSPCLQSFRACAEDLSSPAMGLRVYQRMV